MVTSFASEGAAFAGVNSQDSSRNHPRSMSSCRQADYSLKWIAAGWRVGPFGANPKGLTLTITPAAIPFCWNSGQCDVLAITTSTALIEPEFLEQITF